MVELEWIESILCIHLPIVKVKLNQLYLQRGWKEELFSTSTLSKNGVYLQIIVPRKKAMFLSSALTFEELPSSYYDFGKRLKRHGSILPISENEYDKLISHFGVMEDAL